MTQQFKFGDRVKYKSLGECVVINSSEHFCYVMNEKGDYNTIANPEELELIPHPDTVRLDFIQKNMIEIKLIENEDGQLFCIDKDGIWWEETFSETVRQSIDTMIREYEA